MSWICLMALMAHAEEGRLVGYTPPAPTPLVPASNPTALAAQLSDAEVGIRDPETPLTRAAELGHFQQSIYRILVHDSEKAATVVAAIPEAIRPIVETNLTATGAITGLSGSRWQDLPAWTIAAPTDADVLITHYKEAEATFGVPWEILAAINLVETRMGRLHGISTADAAGPMQFIPETWQRYGEGDIHDDRDAILAAGRYLSARGAARDLDRALWAYNPSNRYVTAVRGYASLIEEDPLAYRGYYGWEVHYATIRGAIWLPVGYDTDVPIPVSEWCASHVCP